VLLLAHIDKHTAKGQGYTEGYSGSTAWHNSARSRLFLTAKEDYLLLEHQKSNYGRLADPIHLQWSPEKVFKHIPAVSAQDSCTIILRLIEACYARGDYISPARTSSNNAFKILQTDPCFPVALTRKDLEGILRLLEDEKNLFREEYRTQNRKNLTRYRVAPAAPTNLAQAGAVSAPCSAPSTTGGVGESAQTPLTGGSAL